MEERVKFCNLYLAEIHTLIVSQGPNEFDYFTTKIIIMLTLPVITTPKEIVKKYTENNAPIFSDFMLFCLCFLNL